MVDLLARGARIHDAFLVDLTDVRNYFAPAAAMNARSILAVGWRVAGRRSTLLIVANIDFKRRRRTVIERLPSGARRRECDPLLELHPSRTRPMVQSGRLHLALEPGDVKVLLL